MKIQSLCNEHRIKKGYSGLTLRSAQVGDKCDLCDETKGVLVSDKWKVSPNWVGIQRAIKRQAKPRPLR